MMMCGWPQRPGPIQSIWMVWRVLPAQGPHLATEETGVPGIAAIRQARRALEDVGKSGEISLVYAGGIRNGGDVAKALALRR